MSITSRLFLASSCLAAGLALPADGETATVGCQRAIARANVKFVAASSKAQGKCREAIVRGKYAGACPDAGAAARISHAATKLEAAIAKGCGGADGVCGGDLTGEDTPASVGWSSLCPGFETTLCGNQTIGDCHDIAACLECVDGAAIAQEVALLYDTLALPSTDNRTLNHCQVQLGKSTLKYLSARARLLQQCWDDRLTGKHALVCPDANDTELQLAIGDAELKAQARICKACGGPDAQCDGAGDFTRAEIGFPFDCPAVQPVSGNPCSIWDPTAGLFDIVNCGSCVSNFKGDCPDRLAVPEFVGYPAGCGGGPQPTPTPQPCHATGPISCAGPCSAGQSCLPYQDYVCACFPDGTQPCGDSVFPQCNGTCPPGEQCGSPAPFACACSVPACGSAYYPTCAGTCSGSDLCVPTRINGGEYCQCASDTATCGPSCSPFTGGPCPPAQVCDYNVCGCAAQ